MADIKGIELKTDKSASPELAHLILLPHPTEDHVVQPPLLARTMLGEFLSNVQNNWL
jgi:hypothetical protein